MSKLALTKDLYGYKDLRKCCEDFKEYAQIEVVDKENCWIAKFSNCNLEESETVSEFENYLIELTYGSINE